MRWKNCISQPIPILNGVKQGSIISPSLFCIYLDVLLNRLETNRAGCRIGIKFCGALAYADELTLISPGVKGLQSMINICETFSVEYDVVFNETKTVCIMFGINEVTPVVYMSNVKLVWKLRRVWNISNRTHTCLLPFIRSCGVHISIHLALRFAKMFMSMIQSDNSLLSYIAKQATYSVNGTLGENCVFFLLTHKRDLAN